MKKKIIHLPSVPTLKLASEYFHCPRCGWEYPGPIKTSGDVAPNTACQNCGHSYLVRNK